MVVLNSGIARSEGLTDEQWALALNIRNRYRHQLKFHIHLYNHADHRGAIFNDLMGGNEPSYLTAIGLNNARKAFSAAG